MIIEIIERRKNDITIGPHCKSDQRQSLDLTLQKPVKKYLETLRRKIVLQPPYSSDVTPSDYRFLLSISHGLSE